MSGLQINCASAPDLLACADFDCVTSGSVLTRGADGGITCVVSSHTVLNTLRQQ